jgi:hypothetical protein
VVKRQTLLAEPKFEKQCAWNEVGYRCQADGHLAQTVHGAGPWYCRAHFAALNNWPAWKAPVSEESQAAIDARVNKLVPRLQGESEHAWSMRCRAWALDKVGRMKNREPGEDEAEAA